jgi:predicted MFS family arabinose efflux permease
MLPLVATTMAGFCGYSVLLPVAPLWARVGGAGTAGSGLVNGVLLLFTVLTQLGVPRALRRFGWGPVLTAGMLLLGVPGVAYATSDALAPVLVLSAVRGAGFGVLTVTGSSAVAALVGPARRGEAIGVYGLAVALPNLLLLPAGPWIAERAGFWVVFAISALPVVGIPAALRLAADLRDTSPAHVRHDPPSPVDDPASAAYHHLLRPAVLLTSVTLAGGATLTFVPQMTSRGGLGAAGLLVMGLVTALGRWRAGPLADRYGPQRFLWPLLLLAAAGTALIAWSVVDVHRTKVGLFLAGAAVLGVGYGALQNLTLVVAFASVSRRHHHLASSVWNVGFDGGTALGSVAVGLIAARTSFTVAFLVAACLAVAVLPLAVVRTQHLPG